MKYAFQSVGPSHGYLSLYEDNSAMPLATRETWYTVDEQHLARLTSHKPMPGQMIPLGDPRWYSHCQWCGHRVVNGIYLAGQYHRECYENVYRESKKSGYYG